MVGLWVVIWEGEFENDVLSGEPCWFWDEGVCEVGIGIGKFRRGLPLPGEDIKRRVSMASCSCILCVFLFSACALEFSIGVLLLVVAAMMPFCADVLFIRAVVIREAMSSLGVRGSAGIFDDEKRLDVDKSDVDWESPLRWGCEVLDGERLR